MHIVPAKVTLHMNDADCAWSPVLTEAKAIAEKIEARRGTCLMNTSWLLSNDERHTVPVQTALMIFSVVLTAERTNEVKDLLSLALINAVKGLGTDLVIPDLAGVIVLSRTPDREDPIRVELTVLQDSYDNDLHLLCDTGFSTKAAHAEKKMLTSSLSSIKVTSDNQFSVEPVDNLMDKLRARMN